MSWFKSDNSGRVDAINNPKTSLKQYKEALAEYQRVNIGRANIECEKLHIDALEAAKSCEPLVEVIEYKNGKFLKFQDKDIPLKFIVDIRVKNIGKPYFSHMVGNRPPDSFFDYSDHGRCDEIWSIGAYGYTTYPTTIIITMQTGVEHSFYCDYYEQEFIYGKLLEMWKDG